MTFQSPITSSAGAAPSLPREPADHVCGRCRTPFGVTNPECPNAPKPQIAGPRFAGLDFTDEALADMLDEWSTEL